MKKDELKFRTEVSTEDIESVRNIVESTGFFHDHEVAVAVELVEERLVLGLESGYFFVFMEDSADNLLGYTCYGEIGCTRQRYDIYWMAIRNDMRGKGLGKLLMTDTEKQIALKKGEIIYLETSSRELYLPTRMFYEKIGYIKEAEIKDFYDDGDNKVIYSKRL